MPNRQAVDDIVSDARTWRREIHQNPELLYDVVRTAKFVADRLKTFGCDEVRTSIGRTGVVGVIRGGRGTGSSSNSTGSW
jgi:metal-dependent amidase/aminoacylase/carboxypeptidase family protein